MEAAEELSLQQGSTTDWTFWLTGHRVEETTGFERIRGIRTVDQVLEAIASDKPDLAYLKEGIAGLLQREREIGLDKLIEELDDNGVKWHELRHPRISADVLNAGSPAVQQIRARAAEYLSLARPHEGIIYLCDLGCGIGEIFDAVYNDAGELLAEGVIDQLHAKFKRSKFVYKCVDDNFLGVLITALKARQYAREKGYHIKVEAHWAAAEDFVRAPDVFLTDYIVWANKSTTYLGPKRRKVIMDGLRDEEIQLLIEAGQANDFDPIDYLFTGTLVRDLSAPDEKRRHLLHGAAMEKALFKNLGDLLARLSHLGLQIPYMQEDVMVAQMENGWMRLSQKVEEDVFYGSPYVPEGYDMSRCVICWAWAPEDTPVG